MSKPLDPHLMATWRDELVARGWLYLPWFQPDRDGGAQALEFARFLGRPYRTSDMDPARPVIVTAPSASAGPDEPFNQLCGIGWHNDFSTHRVRPRWSLSYIERDDPTGGGGWRVVAVTDVLRSLRSERTVLRTLRKHLPFSFDGLGEAVWYRPLTRRGLRFWGRVLRDGTRLVHGAVDADLGFAVDAVEAAADVHGISLPASKGALLVVDNWRTMHDRLPQGHAARTAVLSFVMPRSGSTA